MDEKWVRLDHPSHDPAPISCECPWDPATDLPRGTRLGKLPSLPKRGVQPSPDQQIARPRAARADTRSDHPIACAASPC